ncbi:MAG: gluconolaconase [Caulobacterales bacterium 68-7]|nr:MAG: gluconolaconase [Caulobacterales bacterium 68-7]
MKTFAATSLALALLGGTALAQPPAPAAPAAPQPFTAGRPLGVINPDGSYSAATPNVKMYGALVSTESCSYDPTRNLILAPGRGANQTQAQNDAFVALINHDGSVHTPKWIGFNRNGLTLNEPYGSDVMNGKLYLADRDGGTTPTEPSVSVIRIFDLATGAPVGEIKSPEAPWINDIAVAKDGTIYGSQTGSPTGTPPMRVYKITPDGKTSVFLEAPIVKSPNGVAIDNDGNIVVLNMATDEILTVSPAGQVLKTEHAAMPGNDGIVIMKDGTKYTSSVQRGGVSKIAPGKPAELIASGIPAAASMCYDPVANQLVIPMNANNGMAFIKLK